MYAASTASTTSSSARVASGGSGGGGGAGSERRVRVVRLLRPRRSAPAFGFSMRGGCEHATGFFVSKVEFNSEAHHQGLKIGDQLVSVNGFRVDDAVHSELAQYLATQTRLKIKVRNVGMIPVKDKAHDPLSWQFVSDRASLSSGASSSPTLCHDPQRLPDLRLSILVPARAKLGCGICKGPEWKPGIFVQFVREGGIAREAGLRPGDQILSCNGEDFANVSFNEAISAMKASGRLELIIREGAGLELVSPESSGYNSSASSAAGERSPAPAALAPPAALRRRLASVAEEAADRADRYTLLMQLNHNRIKRRTWDSIDFDWKNTDIHNFDAPSDIEPDYDCPSIPNNPHTYENQKNSLLSKDFITSPSNRTIINLTEDGAMIQCSYDNQSPKKATFTANQASREADKKTIVVEVHHMNMNNAQCINAHCNKPPPPMKKDMSSDSSSVSSVATLSNAIAEEIQRRKMKKKTNNQENNPPLNPVNKNSAPPKQAQNEKKKQHDALIDEFKKVHRKMFLNQDLAEETEKNDANSNADSSDRQPSFPLRKLDSSVSGDRNQEPRPVTNGHSQPTRDASDSPPPPAPPPMPAATNGHSGQNGDLKKRISEIQDKINTDTVNGSRNGSISRTPTPDYNKAETPPHKPKSFPKDDKVELDSLESYKLRSPSSVHPRPPSNYFMQAPNGTATMKKHVRPVSVTIGEYSSGAGGRREPSKLGFLNGDKPDGPQTAGDMPIANRLQSELALTLSRSNLRKKTEALAVDKLNASGESDISDVDKHFHARYGNYTYIVPLPPSINIPKVTGIKYCQPMSPDFVEGNRT